MVVGDRDGVDRLRVIDALPDPLEGCAGGGVGMGGDELGAHAAPDGADGVVEDRGGEGLFVLVEFPQ